MNQQLSASNEASENKLCDKCQKNKSSLGVIIQGVYYKICTDCKPRPQVSSGHARWERSVDLENHEADIQQPYNKDGSINAKFAKLYPTQAKALFNDQQLRDAELK